MVRTRAQKVARIADDIPELEVVGGDTGDVLVLGWGCTHGAILGAVERQRAQDRKVSCAFLRYLNPFPRNLGRVLAGFRKVLIPELNLGQLTLLVRAKYLVDAECVSKVQGRPFSREDIEAAIERALAARSKP
jgi:2-oxoglutarate ferredoxin oxidoreductase subunit alpha